TEPTGVAPALSSASSFGFRTSLRIHARIPSGTTQQLELLQPVEFDHRHHVADDGIDCRYCHATVENSPWASVPPTATCMGCHDQIWNASAMLEPVRRAYFSGEPIRWRRVHQLPDYVYFDHSIHVTRGIGCVSCHGRLDETGKIFQVAPPT